ncbi:MAG: hypothetical protein IH598_17125 [Bacteroidales bacterium]|nr:hypothetical protein [Bacteroidales bacterium]
MIQTGQILLYPYPYQNYAMFITMLLIALFAIVAYSLYKLITLKMNDRIKACFQQFLIISAMLMIALFVMNMITSLITIHQVNRQLGFSYATPDTPEGELFEIQKVTPGKTMDKAGLKRFDQVEMRAVNDLYRLIIENQGNEIVIPVKRNGELLNIRLVVPNLNVPLAKVSFIF